MPTLRLPPIRCYRCEGNGYVWDHLDDVEFYTPCPCQSEPLGGGTDALPADLESEEACRSTVVDELRSFRSPKSQPATTLTGSAKTASQLPSN